MERIIDAKYLNHFQLNTRLKEWIERGERIEEKENSILIKGVNGQRYIGAGLRSKTPIQIEGVPGNDLGCFAKEIHLAVYGNTQDGVGNTMNDGAILIYGHSGDILAHSMRGGRILVKDGVGARVGIHMKATPYQMPKITVGGGCGDFLGEYMAGGAMIILRLLDQEHGDHIGTGMHGGRIYIRGAVRESSISKGLKKETVTPRKDSILAHEVERFCKIFKVEREPILRERFTLITPISSRPYKNLYAC